MSGDFEETSKRSFSEESFDLETKMRNILNEISVIDDKLTRINRNRERLVKSYEKLKNEKLIRDASFCVNDQDWDHENFEWSNRLRETMSTVFKLKEFRPQQLQAINCVMAKKDVIMIAPTGGGKSLCYQLPALLNEGLTLVISPLISLMQDQIWSLQRFGISAELLSSSDDRTKNNEIIRQLANIEKTCSFKILYVTPERLAKSKRFMNALQKCYLAKRLHFIAIDEVHCVSQYGNDFRPDYKFLGTLKTLFPDIPLLSVTATATTKVIVDIRKMLNLPQPIILKADFNRPNLYYHVMEKGDKDQSIKLLQDLLANRFTGQSGIIYALSINDTEEIVTELTKKGLNVRPYHAMLTNELRSKVHAKWLSGQIQAVVATVAFGMGIDKPNVRFVIHHTMSKSMENYYQESGRAGRDGKRAECILLYRMQDIARITTMGFTEHTGLENAYKMVEFAIDGSRCRRVIISGHFSDVWNNSCECNKMCDRCYHQDKVNPPMMNITEHCLNIYKIIDHAEKLEVKLTVLKLLDAWYQKGKPTLRLDKNEVPVPKFDRFYGEQMVAFLIINGYLKEDFHFSAFTSLSYVKKGNELAHKNDHIDFYGARVLPLPVLKKPKNKMKNKTNADDSICSTDSDAPLVKRVKKEKSKNAHRSSSSAKETDESKSKKKKTSKHEIEHQTGSESVDSDNADDCVILVEGSDIIEID